MRPSASNKLLSAMAVAVLLTVAGATHAATATQNVTIAGTLTTPSTCAFAGGTPTITFSGNTAASTLDSGTIFIYVNCTSGLGYSITSATSWGSVTIGGVAAGGRLMDEFNANIFSSPMNGSGTGSNAPYRIKARIGGVAADSALNPAQHFGTVSGTLGLVVTY